MIDTLRQRTRPLLGALGALFGNRLFLITTVIPTAVAIIYYGFIASGVYISESRFVVRSPERQTSSPLGLILKGAGFSRSQDDSYTVQDFILSRDALKSLDDELHIKEAFSDSSVDLVSRFPGLDWDDSFENLHRYYQQMIGAQLDSASSIMTLRTRAYSAELAYLMNQRLLEMSDALVNKLNERGRRDMILFAEQEVENAQSKAAAAALGLATYRNENGVIDPEKQSAIPLQQIAKLQDELIATKSQILQVDRLAKGNPQLPVLYRQAELLEREIDAERQRVAGSGDQSLATKAAQYQRLALEKEFADKMLASAMNALEQARNEVQRKHLYLERIVQPSQPDVAMEPRRLRSTVATFAVGLVVFGVLSMLLAGVREHLD